MMQDPKVATMIKEDLKVTPSLQQEHVGLWVTGVYLVLVLPVLLLYRSRSYLPSSFSMSLSKHKYCMIDILLIQRLTLILILHFLSFNSSSFIPDKFPHPASPIYLSFPAPAVSCSSCFSCPSCFWPTPAPPLAGPWTTSLAGSCTCSPTTGWTPPRRGVPSEIVTPVKDCQTPHVTCEAQAEGPWHQDLPEKLLDFLLPSPNITVAVFRAGSLTQRAQCIILAGSSCAEMAGSLVDLPS